MAVYSANSLQYYPQKVHAAKSHWKLRSGTAFRHWSENWSKFTKMHEQKREIHIAVGIVGYNHIYLVDKLYIGLLIDVRAG